MTLKTCFTLLLVFFELTVLHSQTVTGKWKMVDDKTGDARSVVEIYEQDGKLYGRILRLLNPEKRNAICKKCEDYRKDQKVEGMLVIEDLVQDDSEEHTYHKGKILNPDSGEFYRCKIWLDKDNSDKLHVRGYMAMFYRTQTWYRVSY